MYTDSKEQLFYKGLTNQELYQKLKEKFCSPCSEILSAILYNNIARLKAEYPDVLIIDPVKAFLDMEDENPKHPVFFDYMHLTPKGNKLLAEIIAKNLT